MKHEITHDHLQRGHQHDLCTHASEEIASLHSLDVVGNPATQKRLAVHGHS
jgi:hypothetical protein